MLINGPAVWSEALIATGAKGNLLRDGYNPRLQVSAMPVGPTVVITRYADTDETSVIGRDVVDQPVDSLVLHEDGSSRNRYRLVAWSSGSKERSLLAIASASQVEIWEVTTAGGISATLRGSIELDRSQGFAWSPCSDVLLAYAKTDVLLITSLSPALLWRTIPKDGCTRHAWNACSWSPCGLQVSLAQNHVLHCFSWMNVDALLLDPPRHDQIDAGSSLKGANGLRLDVENASVGPIAAVAHVSPTLCILATGTKLVIEDISSRAAPALNSMFRNTIPTETPLVSNLMLHPGSSTRADLQEQVTSSSSDIIDLTSIRISTSSQSSLQIPNRAEDTSLIPNAKPRSHLLIVEYKAQQWSVISIVELPHLTSPDVLVVQDMRVVVGSTLSPHLIVAHLDVSDRMEWTASLSGELELPHTHVCRGIYLAERSPFVEVASTEKRKRSTFFHAAANNEPQPIYLSKLKDSPVRPDKTPRRSEDEDRESGESNELFELILAKMTAMLTQLNDRFDDVDKELHKLAARVEQLERNGGTRAK